MKPSVSIIVPCFNEEKRIGYLLDAIFAQTYPRAQMEVLIADGNSTDQTRAVILDFQRTHPDLSLTILDNHAQTIPGALNTALAAAKNAFIVRLDAHSGPRPDYVERCIEALQAGLGENVGGVWEITPGAPTWVAESIAVAAAHPLGVGDALYRHAKEPAVVDTVPFGAYSRETADRVGAFDESLLSNEDYEWNARLRQLGGKIWLDPAIRSVYFARSTFGELARQYWRYGFWKWQMLRRYPATLRWRQALPPMFVAALIFNIVVTLFWPIWGWILLLQLVAYFGTLKLVAARQAWKLRKFSILPGMTLAIATMHMSWGAGFLWSLLTGGRK